MEVPKYVSKSSCLGSTANKNNLLYCYHQVWQIFLLDKKAKRKRYGFSYAVARKKT